MGERRQASAPHPLAEALAIAASRAPGGVKPAVTSTQRGAKKNYAQVLSNQLALVIADRVRLAYPKARVTPLADGTGQEFTIGAGLDRKKIDVGVWDDAAGLMLGVSIKTYTFRDASRQAGGAFTRIGRYSKNIVRNDHELRAEADVLHRRQRYAVLVAVMFLPADACWDGSSSEGHSSFAHQVFTLRKRTGRTSPDHPRTDLFERVFIGLFDPDGAVEFFDVQNQPPRNQPPATGTTLDLDGLVAAMVSEVQVRNTGFRPDQDRYAPDNPAWTKPHDVEVPVDPTVEPLTIDDAIDDSDEKADPGSAEQ